MLVFYMLFGITISLAAWLHWYQTRSNTAKLMNAFHCPWMPPLLGHIGLFFGSPSVMYTALVRIRDSFKGTFGTWALYYPNIHIVTPEDAEIILSSMKCIDKGIIYHVLKPWLGDGLLVSTGEKWQQRRKILSFAFHFNILRKFVAIFGEHSDNLENKLEEECSKSETDIISFINQFTLSNICETAMGTKLDGNTEVQNDYLNALYKIGSTMLTRIFSPWLYNDVVFSLSRTGRTHDKFVNILHTFTRNVIKQREENFNPEILENLDREETSKLKKRLAMLDLLISVKNKDNSINDEGIQEEVDTFMFEGHDTTAMSARYTLLLLANHPDIQEKVIAELDEVFVNSKRHPTYDDLQNMKYTEMVIKESLRLYPSVPFIIRNMKENIQLTTKDIAPAGSEVFIHIKTIHRDPRYYPEPEKFDPDRFLPENSRNRHPYAFIPFSAGPRNCIGQKFAMLELKSLVAAVLRNFRMIAIDHPSDLTWTMDFVLRSEGPIRVKFEKRRI